MANVVVSYVKKDQNVTEDINGIQIQDSYVVTNLGPGQNTLYDALSASGVPNYNDPHPTINNLYVIKKYVTPFAVQSNTEAKVIVTYGPSNFANAITPVITFHGTTREVQTNFDISGNPITVNYTPTGGSAFPAQIGQVRGTKALGYLTFDLITQTDPSGMYVPVLNKLNSATWRGGVKYTWLCKDVQISKVLYRSGWHVGLSFEYDEQTHISTAAYRLLGGIIPKDIANVAIPKTVTTGNGYANVLENNSMDFNSLALPTAF